MKQSTPRVLTIAGSDSGGGAGIQADLKTITALGGFGMSAVTALTAQNTVAVTAIHEVPAQMVGQQIDAVAEDIGIDVVKTGMLYSAVIIEVVMDRVRRYQIDKLVIDPVMVSKSGARLLRPDAENALLRKLLPLALVVTLNLQEAAALSGLPVSSPRDMQEAARRIANVGARWVLVKGGHLPGEPVDLLTDGKQFIELARPRVETRNTHGTGCTFASALATYIGWGLSVPDAAEAARDAVQTALENALALGNGNGPVNHHALFWAYRPAYPPYGGPTLSRG